MASGHVNRIYRPNTWLHRPMLQNVKKSSCQPGAVHTWHETVMPVLASQVRYEEVNGPSSVAVRGESLTQSGRRPGRSGRPSLLCEVDHGDNEPVRDMLRLRESDHER